MKEIKRSPLTEEQKKLIEDNLGFIYYWFSLHHVYNEDHQQDLLYYLCSYIHLYDESKGAITTFINAVFVSKKRKIMAEEIAKKTLFDKFAVRFEDVAYIGDDGKDITWGEIISYTEDGFSNFEKTEMYNFYINKLKSSSSITPNQLKLFLAYINTGNMKEVARMYDISIQAVSEAIGIVKTKIKREKWSKVYE